MVGVSKLLEKNTCLTMLILAFGVSTCAALANSIEDDDYGDDSRGDLSLRQQKFQQQPFNYQRLREKFQQNAHTGNNNIDRNTYMSGGRITSRPLSKFPDKSSVQKTDTSEDEPKFNEMSFFDELETNLPYGIQNVRRDLTSRSTRNQMRLHKPKTTFQSLCPSKRIIIPLETVSYEYRPDHYEEVTCYHSYAPSRDYMSETNKVCSEAGFTCIQLNRTVYLTRRAKGTECWESETRIVPSGCECMWPKHTFGDIITYH